MKILNHIYPYISLSFITWGEFISTSTNLFAGLIFLLQLSIGLLTIIKLWKDIKGNKFISTEKTQKSVEKKYPFLTTLLKYFKK